MRTVHNNFNSIALRSYSVCRHIIIIIGLGVQPNSAKPSLMHLVKSCRLFDESLKRIPRKRRRNRDRRRSVRAAWATRGS